MFHLAAYTKAATAGSSYEDIPAVLDGWASFQNNHLLFPQDVYLLGAYTLGVSLTRARVNAPTLRQITLPQIAPLELAAAVPTNPAFGAFPPGMYKIGKVDETAFETSNNLGAATERHIGGLWVGDRNLNVPNGEIIPIVATGAAANAGLAWTQSTITFETGLPAGRYSIVGMDCIGTAVAFARLMFPGGGMRPGCLGRATGGLHPDPRFRFGKLGEWGQFEHTSPPVLEIFGTATVATQVVYLDLVKIR